MKIFLKCDEAAHLCDKSQYKEISFKDKMILRMHLVLCSICRNYSKQNVKLTKTLKSAKIKTLHPKEKQHLKKRLEKELNGESPS